MKASPSAKKPASAPRLRALVLLGTLKHGLSTTNELAKLLAEHLADLGATTEILRLVDLRIPPGTRTRMGKGDDWPTRVLPKILAADILLFATPIWWGIQSSVLQRAIERLDELNDELLETGVSPLANKVGGAIVTGGEDGAQHVIGNICNFMSWNGLSVPPTPSLSYLGDPGASAAKVRKTFRTAPYPAMARTMARHLVHLARTLKASPYPVEAGKTVQDARGGR